jgi:hypothetical protein
MTTRIQELESLGFDGITAAPCGKSVSASLPTIAKSTGTAMFLELQRKHIQLGCGFQPKDQSQVADGKEIAYDLLANPESLEHPGFSTTANAAWDRQFE